MKKAVKYHLYGLLIYSVWVLSIDLVYLWSYFKIPIELITLTQSMWIFYSGYCVLHVYFLGPRNKRSFAFPLLALSLLGTFGFTRLYGHYHEIYTHEKYSFKDMLYVASQEFTWVFIYSLGYFFLVRYMQKQDQIRTYEQRRAEDKREKLALENSNALLQQEKLLLEKDLLQTENDFLRAQINPHFLYNCLNFFYSETFERQPRLAEAVLLLSSVMRYSLTDFSSTGGLARLEGELEHIRNVIGIHRMRYAGQLYLEFHCEGDIRDKLIVPMVLMTLVENMMKHGDLQDEDFPGMIRCRVNAEDRSITFSTVNKKIRAKNEPCTGIGISNIRQRLSRLYGDRFTLSATDEPLAYTQQLKIPYFDESHVALPINEPLNYHLC